MLSLSLADALSLSHGCSLSLSLSRMMSLADALFSLVDDLSLSRGCSSLSRMLSLSLSRADAPSLTYPLSLYILWFVVVFSLSLSRMLFSLSWMLFSLSWMLFSLSWMLSLSRIPSLYLSCGLLSYSRSSYFLL
jgi:hypothetical protein